MTSISSLLRPFSTSLSTRLSLTRRKNPRRLAKSDHPSTYVIVTIHLKNYSQAEAWRRPLDTNIRTITSSTQSLAEFPGKGGQKAEAGHFDSGSLPESLIYLSEALPDLRA